MRSLLGQQRVRRNCQRVVEFYGADFFKNLRNSHLFMTGGTGFMGTWMTELVSCLNDDYHFGTQITLLARHLDRFRNEKPHLATRKDVTLFARDVRYLYEIPSDVQYVVHGAGSPDGRWHASRPREAMRTFAEGTANVLEALQSCSDVRLFLHLSSCHVYGTTPFELESIAESTTSGHLPLTQANSAYAEAKRYAEVFTQAARTEERVPIVTLRPFAFLGAYQSLETAWALNNFLRDGLKGHSIRLLGDGQTVRSYMYGADAAAWIARFLSVSPEKISGKAFNLGSPSPIQLSVLAELVASHFNPAPEVVFSAAKATKVGRSRLVPDIRAAEETLGLKLVFDLSKALEETIAWHREDNNY